MWTVEIMRAISTRTGINKSGPLYLSCEHGDLSFLLYFSKQCSGREHSAKVSKKSIGSFMSEESP